MFIRRHAALLLALCLPSLSVADEPAQRHGAVQQQTLNLQIGLTWVSSLASDNRVGGDNTLSTDFVVTKWFGENMLTVYAEGSTTPPGNAVLAEGNGEAGTALGGDDSGRFQVSELHIKRLTTWGEFNYGPLLDAASYLDSSEVANDETSKFLAPTLVNNTTIQMPDYTLGLVAHYHSVNHRPGFTLFVSASHGLADNPNRSYRELYELNADGKGEFVALEAYLYRQKSILRLGAWTRAVSDGSRGVYANADLYRGKAGNWNLRWGQAQGGADIVSDFISIAWEKSFAGKLAGLGHAHQVSAGVHASTTEAYLRLVVDDGLELTPAVQWLENPGFDTSGIDYHANQTLYQLRLSKTI
jgi:hypothetical protein